MEKEKIKFDKINQNNYNSNDKNKKQKKSDQVLFPNLTQTNKNKASNDDYKFSFMHSIKFEKMNLMNKKFVGFMKDDKSWQRYRKKINPVSNRLDGSYNTETNQRVWYPNGEYIIKRRYNYMDSGLEHVYEKSNVEEKKPIDLLFTEKKILNIFNIFSNMIKYNQGNILYLLNIALLVKNTQI